MDPMTISERVHSRTDWSEGNSGSVHRMLKMAELPRCRRSKTIEAYVLYLYYRMDRRESIGSGFCGG